MKSKLSQLSLRLGITEEELKSKTRKRYIVHRRMVAMWKLFQDGKTYYEIAEMFGDITSVAYYAVKTVDETTKKKNPYIYRLSQMVYKQKRTKRTKIN